jgi:hypothetical protein
MFVDGRLANNKCSWKPSNNPRGGASPAFLIDASP